MGSRARLEGVCLPGGRTGQSLEGREIYRHLFTFAILIYKKLCLTSGHGTCVKCIFKCARAFFLFRSTQSKASETSPCGQGLVRQSFL